MTMIPRTLRPMRRINEHPNRILREHEANVAIKVGVMSYQAVNEETDDEQRFQSNSNNPNSLRKHNKAGRIVTHLMRAGRRNPFFRLPESDNKAVAGLRD